MSYDRSVELGYYLHIPPIEKVTKDMRRACTACNKTHDQNRDNFCGSCGGKIDLVEKKSNKKLIYFHDFINGIASLEKFRDVAWTPAFRANESFHLINFNTTVEHDFNFNVNESEWVIDFENLKLLPLADHAKEKVEALIAAFKTVYGEDSISLKYGIYCYEH